MKEIKLTRKTRDLLICSNHIKIANEFISWVDENSQQSAEWYNAFSELSGIIGLYSFVGGSEIMLALQISSKLWVESEDKEFVTVRKVKDGEISY